jgi:hypothetical protein
MKTNNPFIVFSLILMLVMPGCSLPGTAANPVDTPVPITDTPPAVASATQTDVPPTETAIPSPTIELPTPTIFVAHSLIPATTIKAGKLIHDVVSVDTAAENRAPYGDSYNINLFERPFMQDMSYVPDVDIVSYNLAYDEKFYYVSIELVGTNPNNEIGIQYAVELDLEGDGFGDYIIVARPPYNADWSTDNVQVVQDTNHDTGGLSAEKSDAPLPGDGYDTVIFDGGRGPDDDPDLAWVRINAGNTATVQFAFKRWIAEDKFMYGVIADAGLKSIADLDYVDRYTEAEAGSPIRNDQYYPLNALYAVDNVCRELQGFTGTGQEPQRCLPTR